MNRYVNPANAITVTRYAALPWFTIALHRGNAQSALIALIFCGVLDLFDGAVARACGCASGFGEMLDAVTDAICYGYFIVLQVAWGWVPWPPMVIFLGLSVVNAAMRAAYARRAGRTTNYRSFAMERVVAYTIYAIGFGLTQMNAAYFAWACPILMAVVVAHDAKRMLVDPIPPADHVARNVVEAA